MKDRINGVSLYIPAVEDLWFRKMLLADPETMAYNAAWGGTIDFVEDQWGKWHDFWVRNPQRRFYCYVASGNSRSFVGETAYHWDEREKKYFADVIILARNRGKGYGKAALELLCREALRNGVPALYDNIAADNPGISLLVQAGFQEEYRTGGIILLKKELL